MSISVALIRKISEVEPPLREVLLSILEEMERQRSQMEEQVSKTEFNELKEIVRVLGKTVAELAEAQKRSEERLTRLEQTVAELAEAQRRTEEEIARLVKRMDVFEERLEGISNSVGYGLEDKAFKALPRLLKEKYGLEIEGQLRRRYLTVGQKEIQVNIYGYARRDGRKILILGECKVRPSKREVERFEKFAR